jgi:hypothetical protein
MDPKEIGCDNVDYINLGRDREKWRALVNTVINDVNFLSSWATMSTKKNSVPCISVCLILLNLWSRAVTICTLCLMVSKAAFCTNVFRMIISVNCDYFHKQR